MGVGTITVTHLLDGLSEHTHAIKNIRVFCKETENQPRHEVVHVVATLRGCPVWILAEQFDVELVQPASSSNVDRVVFDLLDGSDASQW